VRFPPPRELIRQATPAWWQSTTYKAGGTEGFFGAWSAPTKWSWGGMQLAEWMVMRRAFGNNWNWFFIGSLAGMLVLAPEVQAGESKEGQTEPAQPRPLTASGSSEQEQTTRWYGSWSLGLDGTALAFASLGLFNRNAPVCLVGVGVYLIGAPLIHVGHRQPGKAVGSFLLRAGLPALAGLIGYQAGVASWTDDHTSDSGNDRIVLGLEGLLLGEPIRKDPSVRVVFVPTATGATLALGGRF
jgi:hypothetical protein